MVRHFPDRLKPLENPVDSGYSHLVTWSELQMVPPVGGLTYLSWARKPVNGQASAVTT